MAVDFQIVVTVFTSKPGGARVVSQISEAGRRSDWHQAGKVLSSTDKLCSLNIKKDGPALFQALSDLLNVGPEGCCSSDLDRCSAKNTSHHA